jgi:peptidyl-prolyl cis-trans isomerase SurA
MKKLAFAFFVLLSSSLSAQTIFYYGNDSVSVKDFLKAYHKNNTGARSEQAFRDYLDLYIASRLKIREARERGYDTLPQMVSDLSNLRQQILPAYVNDKDAVTKLVDEAQLRGQKDIHLAHIFIAFNQNGIIDSTTAARKLTEAETRLKRGEDFSSVAKELSDDPSAKQNGGDLNWITVFTLPYALENLAYTTPVGSTSVTYQSRAGYHIFKNLGERPDPGRLKAAEILVAFPAGIDDAGKARLKKLADSLYTRVQKGDDFAKLATTFSNDVISAAANGQMQEFGVGQYDPEFENAAFALAKDGAYTKPFLTTHGYHIVKRISRTPPVSRQDVKAMRSLREKVEQNDRIATTRTALANKILRTTIYKKASYREAELWDLSDSLMNYRGTTIPVHLTLASPLFTLGDKTVTVADFISYAQTFRYKGDGSGIKPYPQVWNEFLEATAIDYYQTHLENFNEEFRQQLTEFREGNLFFEIMQRQVWGPAQSDSSALLAYYSVHAAHYNWGKSADAVIFYASDVPVAKTFGAQLRKTPAAWHSLVTNFGEKIAADSARFELSQVPNPGKVNLQAGTITTPLINKSDNTASFAYILHIYDQPAPRSFSEARGLVINDYQAQLEKGWIEDLKKKYPVVVNQKVVDDIIKNKKY